MLKALALGPFLSARPSRCLGGGLLRAAGLRSLLLRRFLDLRERIVEKNEIVLATEKIRGEVRTVKEGRV